MAEERIIKRYANRKLYDTQHSKYVTLVQISEMIRAGDDVKIIDNKSKEDLTSVTLAQIIFEKEKSQKSFLPLQAMRNIIQNGGDSITQFLDQAKKNVIDILPRKDGDEGVQGMDAEASGTPSSKAGDGIVEVDEAAEADGKRHGLSELRDWLVSSQRAIDDWQQQFDDRIRNVARGISPFASIHQDVEGLQSRIAELEAKINSLSLNVETKLPETVD